MNVTDLILPGSIAVAIAISRWVTHRLDGPVAYWAAFLLNVLLPTGSAMVNGESVAGALGMGLLGATIITPGMVNTGKRIGLQKVLKPKHQEEVNGGLGARG